MLNFLSKIIFFFKRPKVIVITGNYSQTAAEAVFIVLERYFKVKNFSESILPNILDIYKNEILIFKTDLTKSTGAGKFKFFLEKSSFPILIATTKDEFFKEIKQTIQDFTSSICLILNFDNEIVKEIKSEITFHLLTFGFQEGADFRATDIHLNKVGTNFKINYKGNIVPFWLEKTFNKEQIYNALIAVSVGVVLGINLVEISKSLKSYKSFSK